MGVNTGDRLPMRGIPDGQPQSPQAQWERRHSPKHIASTFLASGYSKELEVRFNRDMKVTHNQLFTLHSLYTPM